MTPAEQILWEYLRGRKCLGLMFRRQHPFGPYVLDFFCSEKMLAVELDGSIHENPEQAEADAERTKSLNDMGVRIVRIKNEDLNNIHSVMERLRLSINVP